MRITSLQQRLILLLLLPVSAILVVVGLAGFLYARQVMLAQWREAALLRLERAAHVIDMRLAAPIDRIELFSGAGDALSRQRVLDQLAGMPGIKKVQLEWFDAQTPPAPPTGMMRHGTHPMMRFQRTRVMRLAPPVLDADAGSRSVTLEVSLLDRDDDPVGQLMVKIDFDYLVENITHIGWQQSSMACVVDKRGVYLLHTDDAMKTRAQLGETGDVLELRLKAAIAATDFGTVLGPGSPPSMVAGFHSLSRAPWTIAIFAPGSAVLAPIVRFKFYYFTASLTLLLFVLFLIRSSLGPMVGAIHRLSAAARGVAQGDYGQRIERRTDDEIGQLIDSYNTMVDGLRERDRIRNTFGLYMDEDVARDLLAQPEAVQLGGDKREVVILMSDIRGFTPLAESLSPEATIRVLNDYFHHMIRVIKDHRGIIIDFVGDAILVFFDPLQDAVAATARRALSCGRQMQSEMTPFNDRMRTGGLPALTMGIGIHAGTVVVGNIGSESRIKYGIVGSAVNLTQRIQETAQGGEIAVSDTLYRHVQSEQKIDRTVDLSLKGVQGATRIHLISGNDFT
ncbi:MAG: adenylate/guanylate cyclase domain-containing protein [Pseudomonadota bacterium]